MRPALLGLIVGALFPAVVVAQSVTAAYTPQGEPCPSGTQLIRTVAPGGNLSDQESTFIDRRASQVSTSKNLYLSNLANYVSKNLPGLSLPDYLKNGTNITPRLGLALSGGGHRAAIFGLSVVNVLDGRNTTSVDAGLGGVLQLSLYMAGLSGGSWAITSLAQANFPSVSDVFLGPSTEPPNTQSGNGQWGGWNVDIDVIPVNLTYVQSLLGGMGGKAQKFPVTFTDMWALGLARHFLNGTTSGDFFSTTGDHGAGVDFSDLVEVSAAQSGNMPLPIVLFNARDQNTPMQKTPDNAFNPLSNTLYEITPYEFGSWDPTLSSFTPTQFVGTKNTSNCVTGFAKAAFVMATSSSIFNEYNLSAQALGQSPAGLGVSFVNTTFVNPSPAGSLQRQVELTAGIWPNAFKELTTSGPFTGAGQEVLTLVDGGEDGQVIPLAPLVLKSRNLDVVIAVDGSNDVDNFAQGGSLVAAQNRTTREPTLASIYRLPPLPTATAPFKSSAQGGKGLAQRPTFFGCGAFKSSSGQNVTSGGADSPLVIYLANGAPPPGAAPVTNITTSTTVVNDTQLVSIWNQATEIVTHGFSGEGNSTKDPEWPVCLGCALFERARAREGTARAAVCENCFTRYCWDGSNAGGSGGKSAGVHLSGGMAIPVFSIVMTLLFVMS